MVQHLERWSLPIVGRLLVRDSMSFGELLATLEIGTDALAECLQSLVRSRLIEVRRSAVSEPDRYVLTAKGRDLEQVVAALDEWSSRWPTTTSATGGSDKIPAPADAAVEVSVLGSFELWIGGAPVPDLPVPAQRLLAFVCLQDRSISRGALAGQLWIDASDEHAGDSLRAMLSRLDEQTRGAIVITTSGIRLADNVMVDLRRARLIANRLVLLDASGPDTDVSIESVALLSKKLLPDWYDDWVVAEAEDWRQLRMNALEAAARLLITRGRLAEAAGAARSAMKVEPLRESAHATLIRVHLAEGNQSEAMRVFTRFSETLEEAMHLHPTEHMLRLVEGLRV